MILVDVLVGYTGFVGSNLHKQKKFEICVNSKNVKDAYGTNPDYLYYSGIPSEMFIANREPEKDYEIIEAAIENIKKIKPKHVIIISTTAIYDTINKNEDYPIDETRLSSYGKNRYLLEKWVEKYCKNHTILRLPAIYGTNLRKNFIFDIIYGVPTYLKEDVYKKLSNQSKSINESFEPFMAGFYKIVKTANLSELKNEFKRVNYDSKIFTDSRSTYQYYPLDRLNSDIEYALNNEIQKINLVTPPVISSELYYYLTGEQFKNETTKDPIQNNIMTKWTKSGYWMNKEEELLRIKKFVNGVMKNES